MSSSSLIMVYMAPCFKELWPFVYENSPFETTSALLVEYFLSEFYETWSHCLGT